MKLRTSYGEHNITLVEQGDASCLIWHHGDESQVVPLPEDVVYALIMLSERDNNA